MCALKHVADPMSPRAAKAHHEDGRFAVRLTLRGWAVAPG